MRGLRALTHTQCTPIVYILKSEFLGLWNAIGVGKMEEEEELDCYKYGGMELCK